MKISKKLNLYNGVSFFAVAGVLILFMNPSIKAMEEDFQQTSSSPVLRDPSSPHFNPENMESKLDENLKFYPPIHLKGLPSSYQQDVSVNEWDQAKKNFEKGMKLFFYSRLDAPIRAYLKNSWNEKLNAFFNLYQDLCKNPKQTLKKYDVNKFLKPLFNFVASFESHYDAIRIGYDTDTESQTELENVFHTVQKMWNLYMYYWEILSNKQTSFFGSLEYSEPHEGFHKHLFYTRDENGFILFTIFPHENLQDNLYSTYLTYGKRNKNFFNLREVLFRISRTNNSIDIINDPGLIVKNTSNLFLVYPYTGYMEPVPYATKEAIGFFVTRNEVEEEKVFISTLKKELPNPYNSSLTDITTFPENSPYKTFFKKMETLLKELLGGSKTKFISFPGTPTAYTEAEYVFLQDLRERFLENPKDDNILYTIEYVRQNFPNQTLDEVISDHEANLEKLYIAEDEAKIRAEQEKRKQMVIDGEHYKWKENKNNNNNNNNNNKNKNKKTFRTLSKYENTQENKEHVDKKSHERAKKRIELLKNKEIRKHMKYKEYLEMINSALQELKVMGISVTGALNVSSHGSLDMGNQVAPVYRPHGRYDTIHIKSARRMLDKLLNTYFTAVNKNAMKKS